MSSIDDVLKATTDLNDTVSNECQRIEDKLNELEDFQGQLEQQLSEVYFPYWRLTRNQIGTVTDGRLDYFSCTDDCNVTFEVYRQIKTGIPWENRDSEEKEILTAMGKEGIQYTLPEFNIIKMKWVRSPTDEIGRLFYQFINYHTWISNLCYAKLISGKCNGSYFEGITSDWGLCGQSYPLTNCSYTNPHPFVESERGEVLFCMLGTAAGKFPIDRENPKWGYFPYMERLPD